MSIASRDEVFAECEQVPETKATFTLPSGKQVYVEEITALEYLRFQTDVAKNTGDGEADDYLMARLIVHCVTDGKGHQIFTPLDVKRLMNGRSKVIMPLYELCERVNGLDAKSRTDAKKNSAETAGSPSATDSPSPPAA